MSFEDKVCIVTGASSGIGQAIAILFARRGASVTLCGRNEARLRESLDMCVQASGVKTDRFLTVTGDVLDAAVRRDIVQKTLDKFARLDVLVPNAGAVDVKGGILDATEESYDAVMGLNTKSVFFQIQEAMPHLEKTKGNIVVISSIVSTVPSAKGVVYPMSKAALDQMVRCVALHAAPTGVRINAVSPSFAPSRIGRNFDGVKSEEDITAMNAFMSERESKLQPLGWRCVTLEEIAQAVIFLASSEASFITGHCLPVDGGRMLTGPFGGAPQPVTPDSS